jgi:hypothetical protein
LLIEETKLVKMKLLGLMLGDLPERDESCQKLKKNEDHHQAVGSPLHRQDDQVFVEEEETLERKLKQNRQQPKSG